MKINKEELEINNFLFKKCLTLFFGTLGFADYLFYHLYTLIPDNIDKNTINLIIMIALINIFFISRLQR